MIEELEIPKLHTVDYDEVDSNDDLEVLRSINNTLRETGYCYIKVLGGDYEGSIAKFTPIEDLEDDILSRGYSRDKLRYNVTYYWYGRLSWKGIRNNPKFTLGRDSCVILPDYEGETLLKRFNLKTESKRLLDNHTSSDIDGKRLRVGDEVLYMNLRYGCGGMLCKGVVKEFKAHARQGYVSVVVANQENLDEVSDLHYPHYQIYKGEGL